MKGVSALMTSDPSVADVLAEIADAIREGTRLHQQIIDQLERANGQLAVIAEKAHTHTHPALPPPQGLHPVPDSDD